jgi:RHS repeat-associated protein
MLSTGLGSPSLITDDSGNPVQELSFDAWGKRRDPATWQPYTPDATIPPAFIDRGFTFHEHLYPFTLINMPALSSAEGNGRAYDPLVGRFLSADPYIQAPDNTQNLNRYSYCLNNPLRYSDPSGELLWYVPFIFAAANLTADLIANDFNMNFGQMAASAASGALAGVLGGAKITSFGQTALSTELSQVNRLFPHIPIIQNNTSSFSVSPMIGFGKHGFNVGFAFDMQSTLGTKSNVFSLGGGYNSGMNSLGCAVGSSPYINTSAFAGYYDGHSSYGIGYGWKLYGGKTGQGEGVLTAQIGDFAMRFDEDWSSLGYGKDRYRTAGLLLTYKYDEDITFAFGRSMITGDGERDVINGNKTNNPDTGNPTGTWNPETERMTKLRGGMLYEGVVYKGASYFIGHNSEKYTHNIPNAIHKKFGTPYFYDHNLPSKMFSYYGGFNNNYLNY